MLDLDEQRATAEFTRMIDTTLRSMFPRLNFIAHTLVQQYHRGNRGGDTEVDEDLQSGGGVPSKEDPAKSGRIESVQIVATEKWMNNNSANGTKVYMYGTNIF